MTTALNVHHISKKRFGNAVEVTIPILFLIEIYNTIPHGCAMRNALIDYITATARAAINNIAHWTRAIVLNSDGIMSPSLNCQLTIQKGGGKGFDVTIPVQLLVDMYNANSPEHAVRKAVIKHITDCAEDNKKAHWTRAIVLNSNGTMMLNESLWDAAIYRGKQETRMKAAGDAFVDLCQQLDFLVSFYEDEQQILAEHKLEDGSPLLPMPPCSQELEHARKHADQLARLVKQFELGLADNIEGKLPVDE